LIDFIKILVLVLKQRDIPGLVDRLVIKSTVASSSSKEGLNQPALLLAEYKLPKSAAFISGFDSGE